MKRKRQIRERESGAALLIAIFALLLISVVAIALVVSQGTDSALAGNYRTSTAGYYAAMAGLEEARGRLLWKNPDCFVTRPNSPPNPACGNSTFIPMLGMLPNMGLTDVRYILNPASGETVDPTSSNPSNYPDTEYQTEMGWPLSGANVQTTASVSAVAGLSGPAYKWVRVNVATEKALSLDVNGDGILDTSTPLVYDPAPTTPCPSPNPTPGLVVPSCLGWASNTAVQVLELTSLSVLPNGSKRLLQYVVAPFVVSSQLANLPSSPPPGWTANPNFPAALTLAGNNVSFVGPGIPGFVINGQDQCNTLNPPVYSIAYTNVSDAGSINSAATPAGNFKGYPAGTGSPPPPTSPGVGNADPTPATSLIRPNWLTPIGLDSVVQDITKNADVVLNGPVNGNATLTPLGITVNNPMTIVVNGDLDLTSWHQVGYGLLLVTGKLTYDPDATWEGLILVIGQGKFVSTKGGINGIDGAVFIATTRDTSGNLLSALGQSSFSQTNGGRGINFNNCLSGGNSLAQVPIGYKVLSFREIPVN